MKNYILVNVTTGILEYYDNLGVAYEHADHCKDKYEIPMMFLIYDASGKLVETVGEEEYIKYLSTVVDQYKEEEQG